MIFPYGLSDRGKKKTNKNLQLRKLSLSLHCCLNEGQFFIIALAALSLKRKIGCLNVSSLTLPFKHKEI